jgi:hypothetical protein
VGRHRTPEEKQELGERARAMRAAGRSRREIEAELGIGDDLAKELLRGVPVPDSLARPRAKDELRELAVEMRREGKKYGEIASALGVSKSTCSLWLRDLPHPPEDDGAQARRTAAIREASRRTMQDREVARQAVKGAAAASLGSITSRDLLLALAVSYWCEGSKKKPWSPQERVKWMNSDPVLVRLFLEGLTLLGVSQERLVLRVHIHESADEESARTWWSEETGVPLNQFQRSTIKRHAPGTPRRNTGDTYRGCLCIDVRQSRLLYQVLDGFVRGLAGQPRSGCKDGADVCRSSA